MPRKQKSWTVRDDPHSACPLDLIVPITSFTYSPSYRYGLNVVEPDAQFLHEMMIRMLDFFTGELASYDMQFQATGWLVNAYWISDQRFVLIEFKKEDSTIRQYFMSCDHENKSIELRFSYIFRAGSFERRAFTTNSVMPWKMGMSHLCLVDGNYAVASNSEQLVLMPFDNARDMSIPKLRMIFKATIFGEYIIKNIPFAHGTRIFFPLIKHGNAENGDRTRRLYSDRMVSLDLTEYDLLGDPMGIEDNDPRLTIVHFKKNTDNDLCVPATAKLWQQGKYLIVTIKFEEFEEAAPNRTPKTIKVYALNLEDLTTRRFKVPRANERSTFTSVYRTHQDTLLLWKHKDPELNEDYEKVPLQFKSIPITRNFDVPTLLELCKEQIIFSRRREAIPKVFDSAVFVQL